MEDGNKKDEQASKILYDISLKGLPIERKESVIIDYFDFVIKVRDEFLNGINNNKKININLLYLLGNLIYERKYKILDMSKKYDEKIDIEFISFTGCHDFFTLLNNKYMKNRKILNYLWETLYEPWINAISIYIESYGTVYPRFVPVVYSIHPIQIEKAILLTKEDLPEHIYNNFSQYNKIPRYFLFLEKLSSIDDLYPKEKRDEYFQQFLNNKRYVWEELESNYNYYSQLKDIDFSKKVNNEK